ncbi:two-component system sensor histidine kinase EvgS [Pseudomonas sp. 3296]|uniref:ATP-binding protein n=1 Tax=Pseudomonas sp. 3296 TaxID=2817753 RepID=UPI002860174F|nr:transporter substrate-binding domain-containing protein [Pseudomonas sp. 3296]MDR6915980.1 two-component system sensor histidine kinase EvgS [Pseudomonas sp. 3296]
MAHAQPAQLQLLVQTPVIAPIVDFSPAIRTWLGQHPVLRVGVWGEGFVPFDIGFETDKFEGVAADYLGVLRNTLGLTDVRIFRYHSRQEAEMALVAGNLELLAIYSSHSGEREGITTSNPYLLNRAVIVKRTGDSLKGLDRMSGQRLAFRNDRKLYQRLKTHYPEAILLPRSSDFDALSALVDGQADATWSNAASADFLIKSTFYNGVHIAADALQPDINFAFAVSAGNPRLLEAVNRTLEAIPLAGRLRITNRWDLAARYVQSPSILDLCEQEQQWIAQHPKVKVAVSGSYAPMTFYDEQGVHRGLTADVLQRISQRTGLRLVMVRTNSVTDMLERLHDGSVGVIAALGIGQEPTDRLRFSRPYAVNPSVLVSRLEPEDLKEVSDFNGRAIAVVAGNALIPWFRQHYPRIALVPVESTVRGTEMLIEGDVDGAINTRIGAEYFIKNFYPDQLAIRASVGAGPARIGLAVRDDQAILLNIINKALLDIAPEDLQYMTERWRSHATPPVASSWTNYRGFVYKVLGVAFLCVVLFCIWNRYLRLQITQRQAAERKLKDQLEFTRTLIDGSPVALYVRDHEGRLLQCNQSYLDFLQTERHIVDGKKLRDTPLITPHFNERYQQFYERTLLEGEPTFADMEVQVCGQAYRIYHWTLPFRNADGQVIGVIGGWIDLTEREQILQELRHARDTADAANRSKSVFLASMSHEIRTPMNAIIGLLELLQRRGGSAEQVREAVDVAHESAQALLSLIGDILDLSKIESGAMKPSPRPTDLPKLMNSVFKLFETSALNKGLEIDLVLEVRHPHILIDSLLLKQIVSNLLSNAIKFTEQGSIEIAVFDAVQAPQDGVGQFMIQVTDTGHGLSKAQQLEVFEPFIQTSHGSATQGGTGLGLSICRRLAELLGGELQLESEPQVGSTFSLVFNGVLCEEPQMPEEASKAPMPGRSLHVLVVDDHAANRLLLCQQLEFAGHRAEEAEDGSRALFMCRHADPAFDLVITDCNMPNMDGFEFTRHLRVGEREQRLPACPVFGLTANAQTEVVKHCLRAGMNDCLFKPLSLDHLLNRIQLAFPDRAMPFSAEALAKVNGLGAEAHATFIEQVVRSNREDRLLLDVLIAESDLPELARLAHKIKGAAKIIDAHEVVGDCRRLQAFAEQHQEENCLVQVHHLKQNLLLLEEALLGE